MTDIPKDQVLTVTSAGKPVKERITTIEAARAVYTNFKQGNDIAGTRRARLKGLIDGNPPYDPVRMEELGLSYMTNVNFLECRAILDQKASAFFELFFEVPTLIQVRYMQPSADPVVSDWCNIVNEEFTKMVMDWPGFQVNMDKARRESDAYGLGVMFWRDEWDWRPKAFNCGSFIPDPAATLDIEELQAFCLRDKMTVHQLYTAIKDEALAKDEGWDPAAVKALLVRQFVKLEAGNTTDTTQTTDWESVQQKLRNADPMVQPVEFEQVKVIHLLVRESDTNEISHYIFSENAPASEDGFLFKMSRRFPTMIRALWWLPYNNGDDLLRSVRGLASMIEHYCDLSNRFLGRVFDAGFITASLLLQPGTASDLSQLQMVRMGAMTVISPGTNVIQSSFQPQIAPLVSLRDISTSVMRNNTGVWKQYPEVQQADETQKTAREIMENVAKEARVEKASVIYDYYHLERLYREMFRRATKREYVESKAAYPGKEEARRFIERCVQRGIPIDVLCTPDAFEVKATRAIGLGSWSAKYDVANQIKDNRFLLDENGQLNATRDWLAVLVGYQNVDRYKSVVDRDQIPTNVQSMIALENNDIAGGEPVVVGVDQMHVLHIKGHIEPLVQLVQAVIQTQGVGVDIDRALPVLKQGGQHIATHLQYVAADPARAELVKAVETFLKSAVAAIDFLEKQQQRQQQETAQLQEQNANTLVEAEQAIKDRDFLLKQRENDQKQQSMHAMRVAKTQAGIDLSKERAQADISREAEKLTAEIAMRAKATDAKIAIDQAKGR